MRAQEFGSNLGIARVEMSELASPPPTLSYVGIISLL
jgi:hypothetical protein